MRVSERIVVGKVSQLHQYPCKSMLGHEVDALTMAGGQIVGNHMLAVVTDGGDVITAKQALGAPLLTLSAVELPSVDGRPRFRIRIPDPMGGYQEAEYDDSFTWVTLGRLLRARVRILHASGESEPRGTISGFAVGPDSFVDECAVHLVTSASVAYAEQQADVSGVVQRMRPQVVIDTEAWVTGLAELGWGGRQLAIGGEVVLSITEATKRCVMPGKPQLHLPQAPGLLKWLKRNLDNRFGVSASVEQPGTIRLEDPVVLL